MLLKIFMPEHLFYSKEDCNLYGEVKVKDDSSVTYFVIKEVPYKCNIPESNELGRLPHISKHLRHIGQIQCAGQQIQEQSNVAMIFAYEADVPNIYLLKLGVIQYNKLNVNFFVYDPTKVLKLHMPPKNNLTIECCSDDIHILYNILDGYEKKCCRDGWRTFGSFGAELSFMKYFYTALSFPLELMTRIFVLFMELSIVRTTLGHMTFYEHYKEWKHFRNSGERNFNLTIDRILGVCGMLLLYCLPQPEQYLKQASQEIIAFARLLLINLKGNPIGLKLNTHLNNFLLDSFNYHIDLWDNFLDMIGPFVHQVFVLTALFGSMGLSYQLAIFTDLVSIIGLHAHCFYVYTSVLYKTEIESLHVLWKVVRGKRYNVLKNRVESHNYDNRQLYVSTILFSSLFFLFPTVLTYYGVFTFVRLLMFLGKCAIQLLRRYILEFPIVAFYKWLKNEFYEIDGIQLQPMKFVMQPHFGQLPAATSICVFKMDVRPSPLIHVLSIESGVFQKLVAYDDSILNVVLHGVTTGKF